MRKAKLDALEEQNRQKEAKRREIERAVKQEQARQATEMILK